MLNILYYLNNPYNFKKGYKLVQINSKKHTKWTTITVYVVNICVSISMLTNEHLNNDLLIV